MGNIDFPNGLPNMPDEPFQPWEQRVAPGMQGGGASAEETMSAPLADGRVYGAEQPAELAGVIDRQIGLAALSRPDLHAPAQGERATEAQTNEDLWSRFVAEQLYDTKRVTLEHFHLFEWFPQQQRCGHRPWRAGEREQPRFG